MGWNHRLVCFSLVVSSHRPLFRSVPETERHAFLGAKMHAKNPSAADAFMEKLRRGKACRDPNSPLTTLRLSGTQTGSLRRPWRIFPRLVFHIKPSEAGPFDEIRCNYGTLLRRSCLFFFDLFTQPAGVSLRSRNGATCFFGGKKACKKPSEGNSF